MCSAVRRRMLVKGTTSSRGPWDGRVGADPWRRRRAGAARPGTARGRSRPERGAVGGLATPAAAWRSMKASTSARVPGRPCRCPAPWRGRCRARRRAGGRPGRAPGPCRWTRSASSPKRLRAPASLASSASCAAGATGRTASASGGRRRLCGCRAGGGAAAGARVPPAGAAARAQQQGLRSAVVTGRRRRRRHDGQLVPTSTVSPRARGSR